MDAVPDCEFVCIEIDEIAQRFIGKFQIGLKLFKMDFFQLRDWFQFENNGILNKDVHSVSKS